MLTTDAELHKAQNTMFDEPSSNQANRDFLKTLWKDKGLTHVILVTKYRADTGLEIHARVRWHRQDRRSGLLHGQFGGSGRP
jgi:predicted RNA methylase